MTIDITILQVAVTFILPLIVGVVTKTVTSPGIKFVTLAVLATLTGLAATALSAGGLVVGGVAVQAFLTLGISVASYYGVWKPTGVAAQVSTNTDSFSVI